jgi:hypothetical protein
MKGTHKIVIGSLALAACALPLGAAGEKIDYEPDAASGRGTGQ